MMPIIKTSYNLIEVIGGPVIDTDPFFSWIGDPDLNPICILLCDPLPDPDTDPNIYIYR